MDQSQFLCFEAKKAVSKTEKQLLDRILNFHLPPIETFMFLPAKVRKEATLKFIEIGDIVIGKLEYITDLGVHLQVVCFDNWKKRDLQDVQLNLICPISNAFKCIKNGTNSPTFNTDKSDLNPNAMMKAKLDAIYFPGDYFRCKIVFKDLINDVCEVKIYDQRNSASDSDDEDDSMLGEVKSGNLPSHYKNILEYRFSEEPFSYNRHLKYERKFNNPACVELMLKKLGIDLEPKFSLMKGLYDYSVKSGGMAIDLLKRQNRQLALQNVQKGISYLKSDQVQEAFLSYNKALSIDEENVEAFVARGALSANQGDFEKSIKDLKTALSYDANHINAKVYLKEVLIANAVKYEKNNKYREALDLLNESLALSPENEVILSKIKKVKEIIEKIKETENKDLYGPNLPKKKHKKHKSRSGRYDDAINLRSPSSSPTSDRLKRRKSSKKDKYRYRSRSGSRNYTQRGVSYNSQTSRDSSSIASAASCTSSHQNKKESEQVNKSESDEEDLEDFFNSLKKNKTSSMANRK